MTRGVTTLEAMVQDLRLETRRSPNENIGLDELATLKRLLIRTQYFLYWDYDWPFLKIRRDITLAQDQRYYDFDSDMNFERISRIRTDGLGDWSKVTRGITMEHYNIYDSDNGDTADPAERWDIIDAGSGEQIEIWPMPATNGYKVRMEGYKNLGTFLSDADVCTLDDTLIVLFAASHLLTSQDDKLAEKLLKQANKLYLRMRGGATRREGSAFVMGGELSRLDRYAAPEHIVVNHTTS